MKPGKVVDQYVVDGKTIDIRYPKRSDLAVLLKFVNGLVRERVPIGTQKPMTLEKERVWLARRLKQIANKQVVHLIAVMDGAVVGGAEIAKDRVPWRDHAGHLGIGLSAAVRRKGLGARLFKVLESEAKKHLKIRFVDLNLMATNKRAHSFYKRMGFKHVGRIKNGLKYFGSYVDEIKMVKYL